MVAMRISIRFHEWVKAWHTRRGAPSARSTAASKAGCALAISAMMVFSAAAGAEEPRQVTGVPTYKVQMIQPAITSELDTDRPGHNLRVLDLEKADPSLCAKECGADAKCLAYTYVGPGWQGPKARCWLKSAIPPAKPNPCCISGVKKTGAKETPIPSPPISPSYGKTTSTCYPIKFISTSPLPPAVIGGNYDYQIQYDFAGPVRFCPYVIPPNGAPPRCDNSHDQAFSMPLGLRLYPDGRISGQVQCMDPTKAGTTCGAGYFPILIQGWPECWDGHAIVQKFWIKIEQKP